jgi:hypothetical protein
MNLAPLWLSLGLLTGADKPDARLANYQWNTTPHAAWGAQALVGVGRLAGGLRVWTTGTTQQLDPAAAADVRSTSVELVGQARVASLGIADLVAVASAGRVHMGYHPDQVTIAGSTVDLRPIDEWIGGGGLAMRRTLIAGWSLGLEVDYRRFALDTAHQQGGTVVQARESFNDWSARFELARILGAAPGAGIAAR